MGRRKQRSYEARFKEAAVRRMLDGESIMRLSRELDVARAVLYRWRDTYRAEGLAGLERRRGRPRPGQQVVSLKSRDPPPSGSRNSNVWLASKRRNWIFSNEPSAP